MNSVSSVSSKAAPFDYFLLVSLAAIFGSSFMMTKVAVAEIPPATLVTSRMAIASVILLAAAAMAGQRIPEFNRDWWYIAGTALFGTALPFLLISWGQEKVDAGLAAILMATMPLITLVLAHYFTGDERLNLFKILGFCLGLAGVAVLIGLDKLASLGDETIRQYALMGAATCYAINAILTKKIVHLPRRAASAALSVAALAMILPLSLLLDKPWLLTPSNNSMLAALALGIIPTAIGTLMLFAIIKRQGASFLSQINFLVPVFGVLWAMTFLGEQLPPSAATALVLILAGIAIARIKSKSS